MNKAAKTLLVIVGVIVLWGVLAFINAGIAGLGVILAMLALLDIVTGNFAGSNKIVWLLIAMAGLFIAIIGIGIAGIRLDDASANAAIYTLCAVVSIILPILYFLIGRRQKIAKETQVKDTQ
jgi:hypothetical protein